jgi:hypothetical protein
LCRYVQYQILRFVVYRDKKVVGVFVRFLFKWELEALAGRLQSAWRMLVIPVTW